MNRTIKSIRIPLSRECRRRFEAHAGTLNMSNSSFARMLISKQLSEEKNIQIDLTNANLPISYETYIQTYLPVNLDSQIEDIVQSTDYDKSKLAWYLVMKGMETI